MTREEAIDYNKNLKMYMRVSDKTQPCKFLEENYIALEMAIKALEQEPKTGKWKQIGYDIYECSICGQNVMTGDICAYKHCHGCGAKMAESEIHCNCTDEEIAKSFIEDVEAVKDLLPRLESEE